MTNSHSTLRNTTYEGITMPSTLQDELFAKNKGVTTPAFTPMPMRVEALSSSTIYNYGRCWWNSLLNKDHYYALQGRRLRLRFGAMYVDGFSLFGQRDWTEEQWENELASPKHSDGTDAHCWLEDEQGNIYDKFFTEYEATFWGNCGKRTRKAKMDEVYEGISPRNLLRTRGVSYTAMPDGCAEFMLSKLLVGECMRVMGRDWTRKNTPLIEAEVKRCLSYDD